MLFNWLNANMVNYSQWLPHNSLIKNHAKFIIIQTLNSKIGYKQIQLQERVIFTNQILRKSKRHAKTSMFLTSALNLTKIITSVSFVKYKLSLKMAITTADSGVINMFALIVLKRILFLLDMQDRAINVRPKMISSNNNSLITNDTTNLTQSVTIKALNFATSTVSCSLSTLIVCNINGQIYL